MTDDEHITRRTRAWQQLYSERLVLMMNRRYQAVQAERWESIDKAVKLVAAVAGSAGVVTSPLLGTGLGAAVWGSFIVVAALISAYDAVQRPGTAVTRHREAHAAYTAALDRLERFQHAVEASSLTQMKQLEKELPDVLNARRALEKGEPAVKTKLMARAQVHVLRAEGRDLDPGLLKLAGLSDQKLLSA